MAQILGDRYELLRPLGSGGMGAVFLALDTWRPGHRVALKCAAAGDEPGREALELEFATLDLLRHPGIIAVRDFGNCAGTRQPFFTMEIGGAVDAGQAARELGIPGIVAIAVQAAEALAFVHSRGFVHGDVKAENLLVELGADGRPGRVRVADFGLACVAGAAGARSFSGSLTHAAPERLAGTSADGRADLYALGVTLHGLLAGRLPFAGDNASALAEAHRSREAPPLREARPDVPEPLAALVGKLLAKDPARRPPNALAVAAALRAIIPGAPEASLESRQAWARASRLVGRDEAESALASLLERARDPARPGARSLVLEGAEGSAKTRLLDGLTHLAQRRGTFALRGQAGPEPWSLLAAPLRDAARLAGLGAAAVPPALALMDPALAAPGAAPPSGLSAEDTRLAVGDAAWSVLGAAAARPVLLLLDDVDRADAESRWLLAYLARQLELQETRGRRAPLALVAAGAEGDASSGLGFLPAGMPRQRLEPLDAGRATELVNALFPACEGGDRLAATLLAGVGPSPRLLEAWCAELVAEEALRVGPSGWSFNEAHPAARTAPRSVGASLARALALLPPAERSLLLDLALLPRPVELEALAVARAVDLPGLTALVDALERRDFVVAPARADGRAAAASGAAREAILAATEDAERRRRASALLAAASLASVLDDAERASLAVHAGREELARELLASALRTASSRGDHARAARHALRLADVSEHVERRTALRQAAAALLALERLDDASEAARRAADGATPSERAPQAALEGRLELRRGRAARAAELFALAIESVEPDAGEESLAEWRLDRARAASAAGLPEAESLLEALGARAGQDVLGVRVLLARGAHQLRQSRTSEAVATLDRAAALARALDAPLEEAACENNLGVAALRADDRETAARHLNRAIELRLAHGARGAAAGALTNLVLLELDRGRPTAALKFARQGLAVQEDVGSLRGELLARINMAVAHARKEDWTACQAELARADELGAQSGDPQTRRTVLLVRAEAERAMGRDERALELAHESMAQLRATEAAGAEPSVRARLPALTLAAACGDASAADELAAAMARLTPTGATSPDGSEGAGELGLDARCVLVHRILGESAWRIGATPPVPAADLDAARGWASAAFDEARRRRSTSLLAARLALALVEARAGRARRVAELLEEVGPGEEKAARPSTRAQLAAARGWAAAGAGDLAAAESHVAHGLEMARSQSRRVPRSARDGFLAAQPWRDLREALLAIRHLRLDGERAGSFFAVLGRASRDASAPQRTAEASAETRAAERRAARLAEILEISRGINALVPASELLDSTLRSAMRFMNADRGFIVLCSQGGLDFAVARDREGRDLPRAEFAISRSVLDEVIRTKQAVLSADARSDERFVRGASVMALDLRSVLVAPLVARAEVVGAIYLDNHHSSGAFDEGDRELLALLATQAAVAVENARLHVASVEKERIDNELGIARAIQQGLLPKALPGTPAFRVAAAMEPAREIGGDYYDFIDAGDGRIRVAIGDVSGKGVPAGLFMVMARTVLRSLASTALPLDRVLDLANDALESQVEDDKFMTMLLVEPSADGSCVRTCVAGHEPPLVWRRSTRALEMLSDGGRALGMLPGLGPLLEERVVPMASGDVLIAYTDGITECRSPSGEMFGLARLEAAIAASAAGGAQSVLDGVLSAVARFRADAERSDDITLVVLEARARAGGAAGSNRGDLRG